MNVGIIFSFLCGTAFALNNIFIKKALKTKQSEDHGFLLSIIINVALLGVLFLFNWVMRDFTFHFSWNAVTFFVLSGLFTTAIGRFALFSTIERIGPSRSSAIKNGSPMFTLIFAMYLLGETITFGPLIGILLICGGILLQGITIISQKNDDKSLGVYTMSMEKSNYEIYGYMLGIVSAASFGVGQVFRKQGLLYMDDAFFGAWVGAVTSLTFVIFYEGIKGRLFTIIRDSFSVYNPYYLLTGILSAFGPLFFFIGSSFTQVSYVSIVAATEPMLTILFSKLMLKNDEQLTVSVWLTMILVLSGTIVMLLTA